MDVRLHRKGQDWWVARKRLVDNSFDVRFFILFDQTSKKTFNFN